MTRSSIVMPVHTYTCALILTHEPMRTPYAMYVFSPMMQSDPIDAGPRMCTLSHTEVPGPSSTRGSTMAVGWMRGAAEGVAVAEGGEDVRALMPAPAPRLAPSSPTVARPHGA